jgi:hypothetical protein
LDEQFAKPQAAINDLTNELAIVEGSILSVNRSG